MRQSLAAGATFGTTIVFLCLTGFAFTFAALLDTLIRGEEAAAGGLPLGLLLFIGLLGVWAGIRSARPIGHERPTWGETFVGGVLAGVVAGLPTAILTLIVGPLRLQEQDIRLTMAALSPDAIDQLLLGLRPVLAALAHVGFLAAVCLMAAIGARLLERSGTAEGETSGVGRMRERARESQFGKLLGSRALRYVLYVILTAILLAMPQFLNQFYNYTLGTVGIYVLLGLGLNIVVGYAGLLDLGYVAFFAVGAYVVALLTAPYPWNLQWSFWTVLPLVLLIAAFVGVLLGVPVLRLRGDYLAIVTLGFGEIIRTLLRSDALTPYTGGPDGIPSVGGPRLFGQILNDEKSMMYFIIVAVFLIIFMTDRLKNSRVGRSWMAIREDETVAQAMGINTLYYKLLAFGIGAAFAGLGGMLFASRNQFTGPEDYTLLVSINVLSLVIVGGMGSVPGVILGALVLKGLPELLREIEQYRILAFGALLVVMMVARPQGLWPSARRRLELQVEESPELPPEEATAQRASEVTP
jgi:ABC-type branched-subunit amino acid transport system permease subunit